MDRGAWQPTVRGITKSRTQLSDWHTNTHLEQCPVYESAQFQEKKKKACSSQDSKDVSAITLAQVGLIKKKELIASCYWKGQN